MKGFVFEAEDAADGASSDQDGDTITFVAVGANYGVGTRAHVISPFGTYWYVLGFVEAADKLTITKAG